MRSPSSVIPWHQGIYVARGLAADVFHDTATVGVAHDLLGLIAHPLEGVSLAALEQACQLWSKDSHLTWAALTLAFSLCHVPRRSQGTAPQAHEAAHRPSETEAAIEAALTSYENRATWSDLPLPPPAWVSREPGKGRRRYESYDEYGAEDGTDPERAWEEPDVFWYSSHAAEVLKRIPLEEVLRSGARSKLLDFLAGVLDWTNQKNSPPWVKPGRRDRSSTEHFEWTRVLGDVLGRVAGLLPLVDFRDRFLMPILELEGENCWALLSPFASAYVCAYVYDAAEVPRDAVATLELCLERLLQDTAFKRDAYRSGEFSGFGQPELVRTLMFVSVERAGLAARYVNGDWTEIALLLPLINRFVLAGGWAASVMTHFLTLCERARDRYPAEVFANQVLAVLGEGSPKLKGWHGTFIPARIAELVQHFAHRDAPMKLDLAQKFLQVLDMLVDMGDRRSAALQLGEAFREIRLPIAPQNPCL